MTHRRATPDYMPVGKTTRLRLKLLSEEQWRILEPLFPEPKRRKDGRRRPWAARLAAQTAGVKPISAWMERHALRRRSQRIRMTWERFNRITNQYVPRVRYCIPTRMVASKRHIRPLAGAPCGNSARTDLCGLRLESS